MESYKKSIQKINAINWSAISPEKIIAISLFFAKEFASTVRSCIWKYGTNLSFQQFIAGEIDTDNLQYEEYHEKADHWKFLAYFMQKYGVSEHGDSLECCDSYKSYVQYSLQMTLKLLTLVSREKELQGIFAEILLSHDWDALGYGFYKYFLERHLELDGNEGGHEELMHELIDLDQLDETQQYVLDVFWHLRLEVYESLVNKNTIKQKRDLTAKKKITLFFIIFLLVLLVFHLLVPDLSPMVFWDLIKAPITVQNFGPYPYFTKSFLIGMTCILYLYMSSLAWYVIIKKCMNQK